ncbi:hypothetical protein [Bacteroides sp. 224]|uniref:hypothetical protein n=1 Tax=Bacteroides sp. 224 TaxID=2302936 RepID=UPI0013D76B27|nr:hypothetical protein [Bacteroides sp. 224]NDV65498.1 hypothetical protein [Bacteroides sp. 224]
MKNFKFIIGIISQIIIVSSCNLQKNELEKTLTLAGENRTELESVLSYYNQQPEDSLKYKAACFLIENISGHYSYKDTSRINKYYRELDSIATAYKGKSNHLKDSLFRSIINKYSENQELIPDIQIIKADYLIMNIEQSFKVWQNGDWSQHLDFDEFCEYILPYKSCEMQILDNWREYFVNIATAILKNINIVNYSRMLHTMLVRK